LLLHCHAANCTTIDLPANTNSCANFVNANQQTDGRRVANL
jgi:hypothetical protein